MLSYLRQPLAAMLLGGPSSPTWLFSRASNLAPAACQTPNHPVSIQLLVYTRAARRITYAALTRRRLVCG